MRKTAGNNRRCHLKTQKKSIPQIAKNPIPMSDTIELICQQLFDQYTPVNLNIRLPSNVSEKRNHRSGRPLQGVEVAQSIK